MNKVALIGITGGIAAYKALELIRLLKKYNLETHVVMTRSAASMVNPNEFKKESGHAINTDLFQKDFDYKKILKERKVEHIQLADKANVMIIIPATANIIAKLAYGIADDYLTTTALAVTCPVIICPSMNVNMWNNPVVAENIAKLKSRGYIVVEPGTGMLACGYEGRGRLEEIQFIHKEVSKQLARTDSLAGKKIIITAGGTIEKIDDVRFISNRSSGKMGVAIAEECYLRGADVLLLRAKNAVKPRYLIKEEVFTTAEDLLNLVESSVPKYDMIYHAAAVSDFKVEERKGKISSKEEIAIKLKPRSKILDRIKGFNPNIKLIGFKAEYGLNNKDLIHVAKERMQLSKSDFMVVNDISRKDRGFDVDQNEVYVIAPDGVIKKIPLSAKASVARRVVDIVTN